MTKMTDDFIRSRLPQQYPFLFVDKVLENEKNVKVSALKNVTINEPYFQGHFPGNPIMPGVLIIEAMAQTAGLLNLSGYEETYENHSPRLISVQNASFVKEVRPGDRLVMSAALRIQKLNVFQFDCIAMVGEEQESLAASATLMTALVPDET